MRIESDVKLDFSDVLIRPKRSSLISRADVILYRSFSFLHSPKSWEGVPIIAANMEATGTFEMARVLSKYGMVTALHKYHKINELKSFLEEFNQPQRIAITTGIREEDVEKLKEIKKQRIDRYFDFIVIDVPNGYLNRFIESIKMVRSMFPDHILIAGNVVTNEMAEEILMNGADIVKVGIGSGAACTTRLKAGVGYPQLSAVIECSDAAHGISFERKKYGLIVSDGGHVYPSCIAKSFCGGADFVMIGSMFAGYNQSGGELVEIEGKKYKKYIGSSSKEALERNYHNDKHRASEGRVTLLPLKGDINEAIEDILGSLRSTGTYIGARTLKEFTKRATFVKVNHQINNSIEKYDYNSITRNLM